MKTTILMFLIAVLGGCSSVDIRDNIEDAQLIDDIVDLRPRYCLKEDEAGVFLIEGQKTGRDICIRNNIE